MLLSVITTGGRESAYQDGGYNRFTMGQFLVPFEQTARLCGMRYLPPVVIHGTLRMPAEEVEQHASDYRAILEALRDGHLDLDRVAGAHRLNADMDAIHLTERRS
jgi:glutathione-regulated potassium-efflux system ancillary protein KefG